MIRTAFINFIKNYRHFLVIMLITGISIGLMALILFIGILLPIKHADATVHQELTHYIHTYFSSLDLTEIMKADYLNTFVNGIRSQISPLRFSLKTVILLELIACALILLIGSKLSIFLARRAMRKTVANKHTRKGIFVILLKQVISLAFTALYAVITFFWFYAIFLLPLVSQALGAFQSLYTAWLVHYKKYAKKQIVNLKNAATLTAANILLFYSCFAILLLLSFINILLSVIIAVPLLTYNACVKDITAAGYFKKLLDQNELRTDKELKKEKQKKAKV